MSSSAGTNICSRFVLILHLLFVFVYPITSESLFGGAEEALIPADTVSQLCLTTLKSDLDCVSSLLQRITFHSSLDKLNTNDLQALCSNACFSSLSFLHNAVSTKCSGEFFPIDDTNMTYTEMIEYYQYRLGLVCLKDRVSGEFCSDVESSWNIQTLNDSGRATWPNHTTKIYFDTDYPSWPEYIDEDGVPIDPFEDAPYRYSTKAGSFIPGNEATFHEYLSGDDHDGTDTNYGWFEALEYDEFPLEIQCSPCFIDGFKYGLNTQWGDMFHEITEQVWKNMMANCKQDLNFTPALDWRGKGRGIVQKTEKLSLSNCPQYVTVPNDADEQCLSLALSLSVPTKSLPSLNNINCAALGGETICAPARCDLARVLDRAINTVHWIEQFQNISLTQLLEWNPFIGNLVEENEVICVGPPGGMYHPIPIEPAHPTRFTATANPAAPTSNGTISNCGLYHTVQPGEICYGLALRFRITFGEFRAMNPSIDSECHNLLAGFDYCVARVDGPANPTLTSAPGPMPTSIQTSTDTSASTSP